MAGPNNQMQSLTEIERTKIQILGLRLVYNDGYDMWSVSRADGKWLRYTKYDGGTLAPAKYEATDVRALIHRACEVGDDLWD